MELLFAFLACAANLELLHAHSIDRQKVVSRFNPIRRTSSKSTPMQVGNGDFAFGVDVTGLQTFQPFAIQFSWGWHNFSFPAVAGQSETADFTGLDWSVHGRQVTYNQPNSAEPLISNWLMQNPQRLNLGRVGFAFDTDSNIAEADLTDKEQMLDLYSGTIISTFRVFGSPVTVNTCADPSSDSVSVQISSPLIVTGELGIYFDYPYPDLNKFDASFVGVWNQSEKHVTCLQSSASRAQITHAVDATTYYTSIQWNEAAVIRRGNGSTPHRYILLPASNLTTFDLTINYSPTRPLVLPDSKHIMREAKTWWEDYWESGAFIDLASTGNKTAIELQRRIILSQYHLVVNGAGRDPPQESGLVNNGWYGKFHLEMVFWHLGHWALWDKQALLTRSVPWIYDRFLESSKERAGEMGSAGARWGKMSDATGRSAPGKINSLLIWQQPHSMYFAEMEWRSVNGDDRMEILEKWDELLTETAAFMADFAWWNENTNVYDLGPPMYPVSENTNPNRTMNPTFELAYWHFGLRVASRWKCRLNQTVPEKWTHVLSHLAPLLIVDTGDEESTYPIYQGVPNMWVKDITKTDHPAMVGIYGLLPDSASYPVNMRVLKNTANRIRDEWDFENLFG